MRPLADYWRPYCERPDIVRRNAMYAQDFNDSSNNKSISPGNRPTCPNPPSSSDSRIVNKVNNSGTGLSRRQLGASPGHQAAMKLFHIWTSVGVGVNGVNIDSQVAHSIRQRLHLITVWLNSNAPQWAHLPRLALVVPVELSEVNTQLTRCIWMCSSCAYNHWYSSPAPTLGVLFDLFCPQSCMLLT